MKLKVLLFALGISIMAQSCFSTKLTDEEISVKKQQLEKAVQAGIWRIDVDRCTGFAGKIINLTGTYYLQMQGDSAEMRLPFYGQTNDPLLHAKGGVDVKNNITSKSIKATPKGDGWEIKFKIASDFEYYDVKVTIYYDDGADFYLFPSYRSDMSYYGTATF